MAATATQIARLRRMVAEPTTATYSNDDLAEYIERYPLTDAAGYEPDHAWWTATYDLNAAAADVWDEKAATSISEAASGAVSGSVESVSVAGATFTLGGGGSSSSSSDSVSTAQERARYFRSRRAIRSFEAGRL